MRSIVSLAVIVLFWTSAVPAGSQKTAERPRTVITAPAEPSDSGRPDYAWMLRQQAETDRTWRAAGDGFMQVEKITYRSSRGDLDAVGCGKPHCRLVWGLLNQRRARWYYW